MILTAWHIVNGVAFMELRTRDPIFYEFYCCPDKRGLRLKPDPENKCNGIYFCGFDQDRREIIRKTAAHGGRQFVERPDWCPCKGMSLAEIDAYLKSRG